MGHNEKHPRRRGRMLGTAAVVAALTVGAAGCSAAPAERAAVSGGSNTAKTVGKGVGGTAVGGGVGVGVCGGTSCAR